MTLRPTVSDQLQVLGGSDRGLHPAGSVQPHVPPGGGAGPTGTRRSASVRLTSQNVIRVVQVMITAGAPAPSRSGAGWIQLMVPRENNML